MIKKIIKLLVVVGVIVGVSFLGKQKVEQAFDDGYAQGLHAGIMSGEMSACEQFAQGLEHQLQSNTGPLGIFWEASCLQVEANHPLIGIANQVTHERHVFDLQMNQIPEDRE